MHVQATALPLMQPGRVALSDDKRKSNGSSRISLPSSRYTSDPKRREDGSPIDPVPLPPVLVVPLRISAEEKKLTVSCAKPRESACGSEYLNPTRTTQVNDAPDSEYLNPSKSQVNNEQDDDYLSPRKSHVDSEYLHPSKSQIDKASDNPRKSWINDVKDRFFNGSADGKDVTPRNSQLEGAACSTAAPTPVARESKNSDPKRYSSPYQQSRSPAVPVQSRDNDYRSPAQPAAYMEVLPGKFGC